MALWMAGSEFIWDGTPPEPEVAPECFAGVLSRRAIAYCLIDVFLVLLLCAVAAVVFAGITIFSFGTLRIVWALYGLVPLAYHTLTIGGRHSATPGMRALGLEVRTWSGARPTFLQALVLTVTFYMTTAATASLVLLFAFFNRRHCTLHDLIAGTLVIRRFPEPALMNT